MAESSWQGLKEAIRFPHTRIRFSEERVPPPYILGIQIISGTEQGFFSDLKLGFVENLNCLIGARGSGKSTIVDAIRYVFGYNRTLDELDSVDLKKAVKERQKLTLRDSIVRVAYKVNERDVHFLEAVYGGERADYVTKVYDNNGNIVHVDDVERSGKYPLRLFGWSEIETLGRDPQRQMGLLDKLVKGSKELIDKRDAERSKLRQNSQQILAQAQNLIEIFNRDDKEIRRYQEYRQEFDKYNTEEVKTLFANLDVAREQKSLLSEFKKTLVGYQSKLSSLTPIELEKKLQDDLSKNPSLLQWWSSIKTSRFNLPESEETIQANLDSIVKKLDDVSDVVELLVTEMETQIEKINEQIRKTVSIDPEQHVLATLRQQAKERLERTNVLREEYEESFHEFNELFQQRKEIVDELHASQQEITNHRQEKRLDIESKLNEFQTEEMKVEIQLVPNGNKIKFEKKIYELKFLADAQRNYKARKWHEILSQALTPTEFTSKVLISNTSGLTLSRIIDGEEYSITNQDASNIIESLIPYKNDEFAMVKEIEKDKLEVLLDIEETEWDDKIIILRNEQPVEKASPGQRSSAMLPLIALAETVPLVIDQPEDNLDNRLVGKVLVDILAKLKEKRQIIVCTHNPNIVVLGDAEQVIVLDAIDNNHGHVDGVQASIDHPIIVKKVIDLMEGGKDAFETRRKRYGQ
jgi:DNA repair ATPase RecN